MADGAKRTSVSEREWWRERRGCAGLRGEEGRAALTTRPQNRARASGVTQSRTAAQARSQAGVVTATPRHALIPSAAGHPPAALRVPPLSRSQAAHLAALASLKCVASAACVRAVFGFVCLNFAAKTWARRTF